MTDFNLANSFVIGQNGNGSKAWVTFGEDYPEKGDKCSFSGECWIEEDILFLSVWTSIDRFGIGYTLDGAYNSLYELPKWNKTKYFIKSDNVRDYYLCYCESGEDVPYEEATPIMEKFGFLKADTQ